LHGRAGICENGVMAAGLTRKGNAVLGALITLAVAAALAAAATAARAALTPVLGALSPFMLYIAAVLAAGLIRGPLCGGLVMLAGGVLGFRLFLSANGVAAHGSVAALMIFWAVSTPVLITANELRVQLREAMARLSAALERRRIA
jgi:K+-sensing histidine kinase KdpD